MVSQEALKHAEVIFEYMKMDTKVESAEVIFVLWSHDLSVAKYAGLLYHQWMWSKVLVSWSHTAVTKVAKNYANQSDQAMTTRKKLWVDENEAQLMKKVLLWVWVPEDDILIEDQATNTELNITYWYQKLKERRLENSSILVLQKPYMVRRVYATLMKQRPWESTNNLTVWSESVSFQGYVNDIQISLEEFLTFLVGDLDRIIKYPYPPYEFQIKQEVPKSVLESFEYLKSAWYTSRLLP